MKVSLFKPRKTAALLLGLGLGAALLLAGQQELSWAAPGQRPDRQTVPPRPPTDTPAPPPPSPVVTDPPPDNDDNDHEVDKPLPTSTLLATLAATPGVEFTTMPASPTPSPGSELEDGISDTQPPLGSTPDQNQTKLEPVGTEKNDADPQFPTGGGPANEPNIALTPPGAKPVDEAQLDTTNRVIVSQEGYYEFFYWLYALILGAALILLGIFLIRKS